MAEQIPQESASRRLLKTMVIDSQDDAPFAEPRETGPLDFGLGAPWVVELRIEGTPITVRLQVENRVILGRSDVVANVFPDVDLTSYSGAHKGVSRQHATIVAQADRLMVMDLDSTNGTYVNGQRLVANELYRLRHGDDVHLGELQISVALAVMPMHENVLFEQPWVPLVDQLYGGDGQRVLIVEGDKSVAEALRTILVNAGYEVKVVPDMAGAFYAVTLQLPDVIVMNLGVGDINGLELSRYVRRLKPNSYAPIIAISEDTRESYVAEVLEAGVDVFLGKPVGINKLIQALASLTQDIRVSVNQDVQ